MAAVDPLRHLAAAGIGDPQMHAVSAHLLDAALAEERLGRGEPDELDALLLGVADFALRPRHVGAVTAIEAAHGLGALAHRRAHAIHRGVAAADDHDILPGGVEIAAVESGDRVAE